MNLYFSVWEWKFATSLDLYTQWEDQPPSNTRTLRLLKTLPGHMGKHKPAAEPFYKAITSKDIRDYKTIKHRSKIHFQQERGRELMCHHLCCIKLIHQGEQRTTCMAVTHIHTQKQASFKSTALTLMKRDHNKLFSVCLMGCEQNMCIGFCPRVVRLQTDSS